MSVAIAALDLSLQTRTYPRSPGLARLGRLRDAVVRVLGSSAGARPPTKQGR